MTRGLTSCRQAVAANTRFRNTNDMERKWQFDLAVKIYSHNLQLFKLPTWSRVLQNLTVSCLALQNLSVDSVFVTSVWRYPAHCGGSAQCDTLPTAGDQHSVAIHSYCRGSAQCSDTLPTAGDQHSVAIHSYCRGSAQCSDTFLLQGISTV